MQIYQLKEGGYMSILNVGQLWVSLTDVSLFEAVSVNTCHTSTSFFYVYWIGRY